MCSQVNYRHIDLFLEASMDMISSANLTTALVTMVALLTYVHCGARMVLTELTASPDATH